MAQAYSNSTPLVVFRSSDICFLGIIRSCKAAGIPVISIVFNWEGAGRWYSEESMAFEAYYQIDNPHAEPKKAASQFVEIIKNLSQQYAKKIMVLPSSDTNLMFLLDYYKEFSRYIRLMGAKDFDTPRLDVVHKASCAELIASSAPELVPITMRCKQASDIESIVSEMTFPAVYKPAVKDYGQTFYRSHNGSKAIECNDADDLRCALKKEMDAGFDLVVQEKIIFDSVYDEIPFYLYADENGHISMAANGIKELIDPFPYGTAIVLRFAWCPDLLEAARKVVAALKYRGILMIEFVKDKKDGRWKVIEINARHWLFNGFYQRLGLNFTDHLYKDLCSKSLNGDRVLASPQVMAADYTHIDVQSAAVNFFKEPQEYSLNEYVDRLKDIKGTKTSAYYDSLDPIPGIRRFEDMISRFQWDKREINTLIDIFS